MAFDETFSAHARRIKFGHRGFFKKRFAGVFQARGVVDQQPRGFDLDGHFGELELHGLETVDRLAELLAFGGVFQRGFIRALRDAEHLRADADAAFVQGFDRNLVAFADFAENVFFRHLAVVENQFGRR